MASSILPIRRLALFLAEDKADLLLLLVYVTMSSLLSLSLPLAAQALINTIASGLFLQPLVLLTVLVFLGLLFSGTLRSFEVYLVEIVQRRVFTRIALRLARHIPKTTQDAFGTSYPPELVNRFFDTATVQKTLAKLLLSVPSSLLQGTLAFVLMGFYSPFLIGFDLLLLLGLGLIYLLGFKAVATGLEESTEKYKMGHWLEELARCQLNFKMNADTRFAVLKAHNRVLAYITARKQHFGIVFRQRVAGWVFYALANASLLALGGLLVIQGQLTLGQLVAAELTLLILLNALEKVTESLESFYDLQTSLDKLGKLFDLHEEANGSMPFQREAGGMARLELRQVHFKYTESKPVLQGLTLSIPAGSKLSVVGKSGSGKSTLALLLTGLLTPEFGNVSVNGLDFKDMELSSFRDNCSLVTQERDLFQGSLEDNIVMNRSKVTQEDLRWALEVVELTEELPGFKKGLQTQVMSEGKNLSEGTRCRVMLARALVERPALLVLDEAMNGVDEATKLRLLEKLNAPEAPWTLVHMTHELEVIARSQQVVVLENGHIVEAGSPWELAKQNASSFSRVFPLLTQVLRNTPKEVLLASALQ